MIDTAEKRLSIMDFEGPSGMSGMPKPSGVIDAPERFHFLWLYSGIAPTPPPSGGFVEPPYFIVNCGRMMHRGLR